MINRLWVVGDMGMGQRLRTAMQGGEAETPGLLGRQFLQRPGDGSGWTERGRGKKPLWMLGKLGGWFVPGEDLGWPLIPTHLKRARQNQVCRSKWGCSTKKLYKTLHMKINIRSVVQSSVRSMGKMLIKPKMPVTEVV